MKLSGFHTNIFEAVIFFLTFLGILGLCFYFYGLSHPDPSQHNPFEVYDNNKGIIIISVVDLIARVIFCSTFLILCFDRFASNATFRTLYLSSAILIAFLKWYELYYGSTFYYGEVRDKQGITFPFLSSILVTLVIWKINYSKTETRNLTIRIVLTAAINIGLYLFYNVVYERWNLSQS